MQATLDQPLELTVSIQPWALLTPFRITGYVWESVDLLFVSLAAGGRVGRSEAAGVYYRGDSVASVMQKIESLRSRIERGISRDELQTLLPPGGARNALDCALWDLEAQLTNRHAWQIAELERPRPLLTTFTCGADEPEKMAATARSYTSARAIKLKLTGEPIDVERVRAVRSARGDVWLGVDANQGFTRTSLEKLLPVLLEARVALIEQPFPVGQEAQLDRLASPIPIAADESVQGLSDIPRLAGRFNVVNIKLDKCGGLTEALAMVRVARAHGLDAMVGNMMGTSLGMAPAFLVGQLCNIVDLDGPVFLKADRANPVEYINGSIMCPQLLWGSAALRD
jgi:L-Ala-D/L-Glu epimerase / N-acetyl-D-glutamate racemase